MQHFEVFQLGSTENMMDFVNIANTISADQKKEEVWLEVQTFRSQTCRRSYGKDRKLMKIRGFYINSL